MAGIRKRKAEVPMMQVWPKVKQPCDIVGATSPLSREEAAEVFSMAFKRVMDAERGAIQGGVQQQHNIVLVRLATRYQQEGSKYDEMLTEFIAKDHRRRTELALLWLAELYAQYQGFSICFNFSESDGSLDRQAKYDHYNRVMCGMLKHFHERELTKEVISYKLILDSPLVTPHALEWLKLTCIDPTYGSYGMTTVRELILTRNRQRKELLKLLFQFGFYDTDRTVKLPTEKVVGLQKIRKSCIEIIRELYEVEYLKNDLREELVAMIESCTEEKPPAWFVPLSQTGAEEWTTSCIRCALATYFAVMSTDPSLLLPLTLAYAKAPEVFQTEVTSSIDHTIRTVGRHNEHVMKLSEECPVGAENLLAKITSTFRERG